MKFLTFTILLSLPLAFALPAPETDVILANGVANAAGKEAIAAGKAIPANSEAAKFLKPVALVETKEVSANPALEARATLESGQANDQYCEIIVPAGSVLNCYAGPSTAYAIYYYLYPYYFWDISCYTVGRYINGNPYWLFIPALSCYIPDYWTNCNRIFVRHC